MQPNSTFTIINEGPLGCAFIAEPEVLNLPRLLSVPYKLGWVFSRLARTIRLNQEEFSLSQFQEGFAAFRIGAVTQHDLYNL